VRVVVAACIALCGCHRACKLNEIELSTDAVEGDASVVDAPRPDGEPQNCPATYTIRLQSTASLYRSETAHASWTSAEKDCENDATASESRTHLVVWSNMAERDELKAFLTGDTWIGASSRTVGTYAWVTDEDTGGYVLPVMQATPAVTTPLPWEPDQPDSGTGHCAESRLSGFLHDESCTDMSAYICECDDHAEVPTNF
jgi:hypothetical protein